MVFKTVASSAKTIVDLTDAYTVTLSNESVSIACDVAGTAIAGELGVSGKAIAVLSVYKGSLALTPVAAVATPAVGQYKYIIGTTTGSVVTRTNDSTFYIASVSADSGTIPVTIYLEGTGTTVSKLLTWNKSKTGATGAVGTSVSSIVEEYYLSTSNSSQTGGSWSTTAPTWTQGTYIWTRSKINYINPTSTVTTSPICVSGSTGNTGTQGISITAVDVFYYLSTSNTTQTGGSWNTTAPTWTDGSYIWSKTRTTYSNASTTESTPACITGGKGATGTAGRSVTSVVEEYYYSTSSSTQTGDTWGTAVPTWVDGKFLWTRTKTTFSDASNSTTTPVCVTGQKGTDGIIYYQWVKYADDAAGLNISDSPTGKRYMGIAVGKTSATESTTPGDYSWSPLYDNVVVGGTNLWLNSTPEKSYANWTAADGTKSLDATVLWAGKKTLKFIKASVASGGVSNNSVRSGLPAATQFTYSFMINSSVSMSVNSNSLGHMQVLGTSDGGANVHRETAITYSPSTIPANKWTKVSITFSTPAEASAGETFTFRSYLYYLTYGATYYFADFQLERGNIATDWTPAPEDVQSQIDSSVLATDVEYYLSTSTSSATGGSWVTTAPAWTTGKYMWTRTKVTTNAGVVSYRPDANGTCIAGAVGATGGIGNTGIGVSAIVEQYYLSTSNSSQAGSSWGTAMPAWVLGKFLWTRSAVTWTDASTTYTTPVLANALNTANETATTALQDATDALDAVANAEMLATAMAQGKMLNKDVPFAAGSNGLVVYRTATLSRVASGTDSVVPATTSGYMMKINVTGAPGTGGGFTFGSAARANAHFVSVFTAKAPVGTTITFATNGIGTGSVTKWLTPNIGTGNWEEYAYSVTCGATGTFADTNYFYFTNATYPFDVYLAKATVYDATAHESLASHLSNDPEVTRIIGRKIWLDGEVYIEDAFVTDLVANSIIATTIQATELNAAKITSGSINADRIAVGSLSGDKITVNTIDATRLKIGSGAQGGYINNPRFTAWAGTYPDGTSLWSAGGISKVTVDTVPMAQFAPAAGAQQGMTLPAAFFANGIDLDGMQYFTLECRFRLTVGTNPSGACFLVDIARQDASSERMQLNMTEAGTTLTANTWYVARKVFKLADASVAKTFKNVSGFLLANYSGAGDAAKTIQFASVNMFQASAQEYLTQSWTSAGTTSINGGLIATDTLSASTITVGTLPNNRLSAIPSSKFDTTTQTTLTNAGTAYTRTEGWKHPTDVTTIDGGKIYTGSITAAQIQAGSLTVGNMKRYSTSNTGASYGNYWTKIATVSITAQYGYANLDFSCTGGGDGSDQPKWADVQLRVKQQNVMGGLPGVNLHIKNSGWIMSSEFGYVVAANTVSLTTIDVYVRIRTTYDNYVFVLSNVSASSGTYSMLESQTLVASVASIVLATDKTHAPTTATVATWKHATDTTTIDGAKIYTGTISAEKISLGTGNVAGGNLNAGKTLTGTTSGAVATDGARAVGSAYHEFGAGTGSPTTGAESAYVQVDLGSAYRIAQSKIYWYAADMRIYYYKVKYSTDGTTWYYAVGNDTAAGWSVSAKPYAAGEPAILPTTDTFAVPISARYVRIYGNGNTVNLNNHIYEWEMYSTEETIIHGDMIRTGTINASKITTGSLSADRISAGTINAGTGVSTINMNTGEFSFGGGKIALSGSTLSINVDSLKISNSTVATESYTNTQVANIEISGRNTFKTTTDVSNLSGTTTRTANALNGTTVVTTVAASSIRVNNVITGNGNWTFSAWVTSTVGGTLTIDFADNSSQTFPITTTRTKIVRTGLVANYSVGTYHFIDISGLPISTVTFEDIKIENGTKATSWTAAPEDIDAKIEVKADSQEVSGNLNIVSTAATNAQATADAKLNTSVYDDFLEEYASYKDAQSTQSSAASASLEAAKASVASITNEMGSMKESWVFNNGTKIDATGSGMLLSDEAGGMNLLLSNNRISFFDSGVEVAYIADKTLKINHGIFVKSAQIGAHLISQSPSNPEITIVTWVG